MGGDEFCVLAPWDAERAPDGLIERTRAALSSDGDGFKVGASCGFARIPGEGLEASEALRVADRRLYAEKNSGRISALAQSKTVLLRAVGEWDAELSARGQAVAALAAAHRPRARARRRGHRARRDRRRAARHRQDRDPAPAAGTRPACSTPTSGSSCAATR